MMEPISGTLTWRVDGKRRLPLVTWQAKKGPPVPVPRGQLDRDLEETSANREEVPVHLDLESGQPRRVRRVGAAWAAAPAAPPVQPPTAAERPRSGPAGGRSGAAMPPHTTVGEFHNPYGFIPAPVRDGVQGELGDQAPISHASFASERISGRIGVTMEVVTPLLLLDAARARMEKKDHQIFPVRLGPDGFPLVPPTSVKGMLRSAFEAVTNSRLAVFQGHDKRLGYRHPAQATLIPARIESGQVVLMRGTTPNIPAGPNARVPQAMPLHAAWWPRYVIGRSSRGCAVVGAEPEHEQPAIAWIELWERYRQARRTGQFNANPDFRFWTVRAIGRAGTKLSRPQASPPVTPAGRDRRYYTPVRGEPLRLVDGFACITNRNIDNKHDERFFFSSQRGLSLPLEASVAEGYVDLIKDYRFEHAKETAAEQLGPPQSKSGAVWSQHIISKDAEKLQEGRLCYALVENAPAPQQYTVVGLYPVMISRDLHPLPPNALLPPSLGPALSINKLSPAERVFGWVRQGRAEGRAAYRGNLRVSRSSASRPTQARHTSDFQTHFRSGSSGNQSRRRGASTSQATSLDLCKARTRRARDISQATASLAARFILTTRIAPTLLIGQILGRIGPRGRMQASGSRSIAVPRTMAKIRTIRIVLSMAGCQSVPVLHSSSP